MKKIILSSAFLFLWGMFYPTSAQTVSDTDLPGLQTIFNSSTGFTRIIFLGDPTCPGCISSANELRYTIFNQCNNPDLRGMIVWIHVSGFPSVKNDAINQSALWSDSRITCYWDSAWDISHAFGYQGGWSGCNLAWDISMIYTDTATWPGMYPPAPFYCMSKTGCCNSWDIHDEKNQLVTLGECLTTGINENFTSNSDIHIFPNPASAEIKINFISNPYEEDEIRILNSIGEEVCKVKNQILIDISYLPGGIYFLEATYEGNRIMEKFVKQ